MSFTAGSTRTARFTFPPDTTAAEPQKKKKKKKKTTRASTAQAKKVVMYGASWCGVCHRAKEYFARNKIPYVEYDVETSRKSKRDYKRMRGEGVRIILVGGRLQPGRVRAVVWELMISRPLK